MPDALLLACYELGHQPLSLAWPLAVLEDAGYEATGVDLAVSDFPHQAVAQANFVGIAVPMHTALRLGVQAAARVRTANPQAHICFYGLYAWLNADYLLHSGDDNGTAAADSVIAGEYEEPLLALVEALATGADVSAVPGVSTPGHRAAPHITRLSLPTPARSHLPPLNHYAHHMHQGQAKLAGYTETTRGCLHTCHHCPVVPVYNGRFFAVPIETVMADIRQQITAGAGHITFGDPDFLNGPGQALKVTRALHDEFPHVTFDFTTKVEHILEHRRLFPELRRLGANFVVSAFESVSDEVLARLKKGHTKVDMEAALDIMAGADLPVQPTWVAFTPWTTLDDYIDMLTWIRRRGLIQHVPPVQFAVRLLVPPGSALLDQPDTHTWLGSLDAANFTYGWQHPDPCMDELHQAVTSLVEETADNPYAAFAAVERLAYRFAGRPRPAWLPPLVPESAPPRLTEDWFC